VSVRACRHSRALRSLFESYDNLHIGTSGRNDLAVYLVTANGKTFLEKWSTSKAKEFKSIREPFAKQLEENLRRGLGL
jgi:hypothetical protein